ncbi:MAG: molybdopterin molybdenumtransferase MoeA [Bacteroidetes bacterium]|nr:MAG: molybdopterin molybdenumtransferase MoeA [Bacteroidota bacterium]
MISVEEASRLIASVNLPLPAESVPLEQASGRVLRESLFADADFPPYDRVTMDGIAIAYQAYQQGCRAFEIASMQTAGSPRQKLEATTHCIEIMTGAIRPEGTDTVIRYEDLRMREVKGRRIAEIDPAVSIAAGQNIHRKGNDRQAGSLLCSPGIRISPAEIAIAASIGKSRLQVSSLPKVAIISTGDELVAIEQQPLPHQIRKSNPYMLAAALQEMGAHTSLHHFPDDAAEIEVQLSSLLNSKQVLVLSGGVSMGKADYIPAVLEQLGVEKLFHKVRQRPGKPFWFGRRGQCVVFALPGNPVSAFVGCYRYLRPWISAQMGEHPPAALYAELAQEVRFKPALRYFMQVQVQSRPDGQLLAQPLQGAGSGDHANLLRCNAIMELPGEEREVFEAGTSFPIYPFRRLA